MDKGILDEVRKCFSIPDSVSDSEILESIDNLLWRNSIELDIAIDELKKEIKNAKFGKRYSYTSMSEFDMW